MIVCSSYYFSTVGGFLSYKQTIWSRHKNWNYFRLLEKKKKISWADEKRDLFYDLHFQRTAKAKFQMMSAQLFYGKLVKIVKPFIDCGSYYLIYYLVKKTQLSKSNLKCKGKHFRVLLLEIFFVNKNSIKQTNIFCTAIMSLAWQLGLIIMSF
jgi:hypothetical protein